MKQCTWIDHPFNLPLREIGQEVDVADVILAG
jgi:hypothetical protein